MDKLQLLFRLENVHAGDGDSGQTRISHEINVSTVRMQEIHNILLTEKEDLSKIIEICQLLQGEDQNSTIASTTPSSTMDRLLRTDENGDIILSDDSDFSSDETDSDTESDSEIQEVCQAKENPPGSSNNTPCDSSTTSSYEVIQEAIPKIILAPNFIHKSKECDERCEVERSPHGPSMTKTWSKKQWSRDSDRISVTSDSDQSQNSDRDSMFYDNIPSGIKHEPEIAPRAALTRGRGKPLLLVPDHPLPSCTGNPSLNFNAKEFKPKQQSYGRGGSTRTYNRGSGGRNRRGNFNPTSQKTENTYIDGFGRERVKNEW